MIQLIRKIRLQNKQLTALLMGVSAIAGLIYFINFVIPRSKPEDQFIFGLSLSRTFMAIIILGLLLINIAVVLFAMWDFWPWQKRFQKNLIAFFTDRHAVIMVFLYCLLIFTGAFLLLVNAPIIRYLQFLKNANILLGGFIGWLFFADLLLIFLLRIIAAELLAKNPLIARLDQFVICLLIFLVTFVTYIFIASWIGKIGNEQYTFWDLLVEQLLKGKLYLENPPYTHDLTFYQGKWYVPMPPLPAILLLPVAYWFGAEKINASYVSMIYSAINGVLLYLILKQLVQRKWLELSPQGLFWLMVMLLFGTPHLWVGISGRGWYVSQILTVLFLALSVYAALRSWSAWWIAAFIGASMLARPNSVMTWPFLFAISMQILKEEQGTVDWKQAARWIAKTIPPIAISVVILLSYNYLRFGKITDFGYATVNAGEAIIGNVQAHGLFSPYFIPNNLYTMFLKMPRINWGTPWPTDPKGALWPVDPTTTGMSIFLTTPALLYLFHRYPQKWWIWGGWAAIFCNLAMLSCYSNNGSAQFGYRYILDFIVPLITLLAIGLGKKIPRLFIALVLISVLINLYGTYWYING